MNSFIKNRWAHFSISFYLSIKTYSLEGLMWSLNSNTLATWCEELTHWKRIWRWEGLKAGGEGDGRGWDHWMASLTRWTWVWTGSGCWWWTGKPGVLQSMASQSRTWLSDWTELIPSLFCPLIKSLMEHIMHFIESLWLPVCLPHCTVSSMKIGTMSSSFTSDP